jgi:hypothetical protein
MVAEAASADIPELIWSAVQFPTLTEPNLPSKAELIAFLPRLDVPQRTLSLV